jgi:ATP-dependent Clp protease adaptor protein ClpS
VVLIGKLSPTSARPVRLSGEGGEAGGGGPGRGAGTQVISRTKPAVKKPHLYRVLLLNDDYTPMEFVIEVLRRFFGKDPEEATRIMLHVHHNGVGLCGVYTFEVAETKVTQVMEFSRKNQHPLQCIMEKQ